MSKLDKLKAKLLRGSSFTWDELTALMTQLGYAKVEGSGSRVKFDKGESIISLHRPHPNPELKRYAIRMLVDQLQKRGEL
jgi:hypothetical protein